MGGGREREELRERRRSRTPVSVDQPGVFLPVEGYWAYWL